MGGAFGQGEQQALAKFHAQIETELRELAGNVSVQTFRSDAFEYLQVGIAGAVGVGGGGNILAQVVEADHHAAVIAITGGSYGLVKGLTGDKTVGHAARALIGGDPTRKRFTFGKFQEGGTQHAT